jgi:hypothetical protein
MKKFMKYRVNSTRGDSHTAGGHIPFLRILAFARGAEFTEKENAHFDDCCDCRLKLLDALRRETPRVRRTEAPKVA